jgi:hypothetical protein
VRNSCCSPKQANPAIGHGFPYLCAHATTTHKRRSRQEMLQGQRARIDVERI